MGCDIHVIVEKGSAFGWALASTPVPDRYWAYSVPPEAMDEVLAKAHAYMSATRPGRQAAPASCPTVGQDFHAVLEELGPDDGAVLFGEDEWFPWRTGTPACLERRNYALFSVLADVRNDNDISPVFPVRGFPSDASPECAENFEQWGADAHTPSWITAAEFNAYPWRTPVKVRCVVTEAQYQVFLATGRPQIYCRCVSGGGAVTIGPAEMGAILSGKTPRSPGARYYVRIEFETTVEEMVGPDSLDSIRKELSGFGAPESTRLVFWFDN